MILLPIIIHGVTGRMGQVALMAVKRIASEKMAVIDGEEIRPVPVGVGRNMEKLKIISNTYDIKNFATDLPDAYEIAQKINPQNQVYH